MSGGSYNYLADWPTRNGFPSYLAEMAHRAEELAPGSPGAVAMRKLLTDAESVEHQWNKLYDVMHDIEWADSGDKIDEDAIKTLREWKDGG